MRTRIAEEVALLRPYFPDLEHVEHAGDDWFLLPRYRFPADWRLGDVPMKVGPVVFKLNASYPTGEPYGFAAPAGINYNGSPPGNPGSPVSPPFEGAWQHFSWAPDGGWFPTNDVRVGSNLLAWVRSFSLRLSEGA